MKKLLLVLTLSLPMYGCVPAVLVAGAAASASIGGAAIYDKRSFKAMNQDHKAHASAQQLLNTDPMLKDHSHINLAVFNHVGLLVGQAQNEAIRDRANQIVANTPHIKRVYNQITVSEPTTAMQRAQDSWITTKVRTMMVGKPGLGSTNLKVTTENGVVYLMGILSPKQADLAVDVARRVSGVNKVVKIFTID